MFHWRAPELNLRSQIPNSDNLKYGLRIPFFGGLRMVAQVISGNEIAKSIRAEIKDEVARLKTAGIEPGLVVIIVGEDPASQVYVRKKGEACDELGFCSET